MKSLGWIKLTPRNNKGFYILLLLVFLPLLIKTVANVNKSVDIGHNEEIFVQIDGDVKCPGVYAFPQEPGLREVVHRGGGFRDDYNSSLTFDNSPVRSGIKVTIKKDNENPEILKRDISAFYKITLGISISLNRESETGLTAIPGIGPKLADVIVREREKRGGFKKLEEIKSLYGIGKKKYKKIAPYVSL